MRACESSGSNESAGVAPACPSLDKAIVEGLQNWIRMQMQIRQVTFLPNRMDVGVGADAGDVKPKTVAVAAAWMT